MISTLDSHESKLKISAWWHARTQTNLKWKLVTRRWFFSLGWVAKYVCIWGYEEKILRVWEGGSIRLKWEREREESFGGFWSCEVEKVECSLVFIIMTWPKVLVDLRSYQSNPLANLSGIACGVFDVITRVKWCE